MFKKMGEGQWENGFGCEKIETLARQRARLPGCRPEGTVILYYLRTAGLEERLEGHGGRITAHPWRLQNRSRTSAASPGRSWGHQWLQPSSRTSSPRTRAARRSAKRDVTKGSSRPHRISAGRVTRATSSSHSSPTCTADR